MARIAEQITIEGRNMVHDALNSFQKIRSVQVATASKNEPRIKEILAIANSKGVRVEFVGGELIEKQSESGNAQGIIAFMDAPEVTTLEEVLKKKREVFILLLNRIDYEQNLGAILRPLIGMSLFQALDLLERYAVRVIGVEVEMGEVYTAAKLKGPVAFLIGGEADGLSEPLMKKCNEFVNIPMVSGVASLNVSVASALVMFEKVRQERVYHLV
ncbi:MAG: rRNA methyltransferase, RNA methyltransferase, TrmH family [Candidatus Collierbacteria bacterium GW2011_GWC1_45_47]|nr:MAG: rRNA methyltransferase, RNA methyltransferase, TrmH family [Candidatus Collierbacteria bacterium GW2011_GWC1_45_47]